MGWGAVLEGTGGGGRGADYVFRTWEMNVTLEWCPSKCVKCTALNQYFSIDDAETITTGVGL